MLRGRMLANEKRTFDGRVFRMSKALVLMFEEYCRDLMQTFGLDDSYIYNEEGVMDFEN